MPPKKKNVSENVHVATTQETNVEQGESHDEHILLELPIADQLLNTLLHEQDMSNILQYVPTIQDPEPYMPEDHMCSDADVLEVSKISAISASYSDAPDSHDITCPSNSGSYNKTKICFWCCHDVGHMTYGMPIRYDFINKSFTMYGTFCSLECAAAHNFSMHLGSDRAWEIHSWIQMLGKRFGFVEPIRPAPSRYLLNMFDGPLTIQEFRNAHKGQTRTYVLNIPPLISVNSQLEVVNTSFYCNITSDEKTPRREKKQTLDSKMNLTMIGETI